MSTCTKWVDQGVIACKNWTNTLDYECTTWADEGSNACSDWKDEGSNQCSDWTEKHCHWYSPWNCIAGWFCQAWYWVANWVCQAWYWVAKWVCKAFAWVVKAICVVWGWISKLVCVAWDTLRCAVLALIRALSQLVGRRAAAAPKIEHVFVLMLENRSFDHMLGFSGIEGGIDPLGDPTDFNRGFSTALGNTASDGTTVNVGHPADYYLKGIDDDPGHEFKQTLVALCWQYGDTSLPTYDPVVGYPPIHNSGFVKNYEGAADPRRIMSCFERRQLPVINALAREFAVCDQWFSSLPGPTWPNRFFLLAASSGGLDGSPSTLDVVTSTTVEGYRFSNGTIFDLLDQYCIPWRIFEGDEFPVSFAISGMNLNALQGRFKDFEDFRSEVNKDSFSEKFVFIEPKYGAHGFDVGGPGDFACGNSMHPLDDVTRGERLIKNVYETIRNSPHRENSLLIITFDEHGGFYDHVEPPPAVPPGDTITEAYSQFGFEFDRLGVRVPALVISPYIERGVVDHSVYDQTSMLATVERLYGLPSLTERDKEADDLLKLLTRMTPRADAPTTLPDPASPQPALPCEDDDDEDTLLLKRSELRLARKNGVFRELAITEFPLTPSQVGFLQVALLKVLQTAQHPERQAWIDDYKRVQTGIDAAIFMAEARLFLRHGIDVKKAEIEGRRNKKPGKRQQRRER